MSDFDDLRFELEYLMSTTSHDDLHMSFSEDGEQLVVTDGKNQWVGPINSPKIARQLILQGVYCEAWKNVMYHLAYFNNEQRVSFVVNKQVKEMIKISRLVDFTREKVSQRFDKLLEIYCETETLYNEING